MRYFVFIWVIILSSCRTKKVSQQELALFPEAGKNKFWLINSIAREKNGKQLHFCALVTLENKSGKQQVNYYTSLSSNDELGFVMGNFFSENPVINSSASFPFFIILQNSDSLHAEQSVRIDRNKIKFAGELRNPESRGLERFRLKMKLKSVSQFLFVPQDTRFNVKTTGPMKSKLIINSDLIRKTNDVFITTISKPDSLVMLRNESSLVWMNLLFDDQRYFNVLLEIDENQKVTPLAYQTVSLGYPVIKTLTSPARSELSGISYHLSFSIRIPGIENEFIVKPAMNDQELDLKKSSFWMGGVEIFDATTKTKKGAGNMYNFSNKTTD